MADYPSPTPARPRVAPPSQGLRTVYLVFYNFVSAVLWFSVLGRVALLLPLVGFGRLYGGVGEFAKWTQTLALLEVVHSLFGIVRAPLLTTVMQVASRLLLVWGIVDQFPHSTSRNPAYASMLVAWSLTEVVRYTYFALNLRGWVPPIISWLRYNMFFVLYPLGMGSEVWLVTKALGPAGKRRTELEWALRAILLIYVPGGYILYTHMMAQRRKILRGKPQELKE